MTGFAEHVERRAESLGNTDPTLSHRARELAEWALEGSILDPETAIAAANDLARACGQQSATELGLSGEGVFLTGAIARAKLRLSQDITGAELKALATLRAGATMVKDAFSKPVVPHHEAMAWLRDWRISLTRPL